MLPVAKGVNNMSNLNHLLQKNKKILNKFPENPNQDVLELSLFLPSDNCLLHEKNSSWREGDKRESTIRISDDDIKFCQAQ